MTDTIGLWALGQETPDALAVVAPDGERVTYGDLLARANRLVHGLRALGLEAGDCVAVVLPNSIEFYALYFATNQAGWYLTPINNHLAGPEIAYIVGDCEAKVFVGHERFADGCAEAAKELSFRADRLLAVGDVPGFLPLSEVVDGQPDTLPSDRRAGAAMHYTSGTTGRPKGVRRGLPDAPPEAMVSSFLWPMFGVTPHAGNVHICGSPLYHTAVLAWSAASMHIGHPVVLMDKWTPEGMLQLIEQEKVTCSHMVPTQFHRLLALPEEVRAKYDVSSLRAMVHAAAPCPVDVKRRMLEWWGSSIFEYYAATEGGGTYVTPEEWLKKPGTVGKAWPGSEIRILDDDGKDQPTGEIGTVYMKLMGDFQYFKDKKKTEDNRREGFFTVGDIGYLDEDGYLFLCDRKADMIISGGANIYPAEIEGELLSHPKVGDAAVFGIPHEDWGEEIKAVIEPAAGIEPGPELTEEILSYLGTRIGKFKMPKSVDYIVEMPRDPNGKLYKRKLRDPYWEGRDRAI